MTNLTERTIELRRLLGSSYEVEDFYPRFVVRGNMVKFLRVNFLGALPTARFEMREGARSLARAVEEIDAT